MNRSAWALVVDTVIVIAWGNITLMVMHHVGCLSWLVELLNDV